MYKCLSFKDGSKTLSVSEVLTTDKISVEAFEDDVDNPHYAPYLSFELDYQDICDLMEWLQKQKSFLEEATND